MIDRGCSQSGIMLPMRIRLCSRAVQKWYTHDARNSSVCLECCNGINPASLLFAPATELCGCTNGTALTWLPAGAEMVQ